jgi:hypothetical protein
MTAINLRFRKGNQLLTYDWLHKDIPMLAPNVSDLEVATQVRMLMRHDLNHESVCTLARDRIMALSKRVDELQKALDLALCWLSEREPPDSRAVSDEFVAMASMAAGHPTVNEECHTIIDAALLAARAKADAA